MAQVHLDEGSCDRVTHLLKSYSKDCGCLSSGDQQQIPVSQSTHKGKKASKSSRKSFSIKDWADALDASEGSLSDF